MITKLYNFIFATIIESFQGERDKDSNRELG